MPDSNDGDLWPMSRVARYLRAGSTNSARGMLVRMGVRPVARQPGRSGENLYNADEVRAAVAARPGRGARTDLQAK